MQLATAGLVLIALAIAPGVADAGAQGPATPGPSVTPAVHPVQLTDDRRGFGAQARPAPTPQTAQMSLAIVPASRVRVGDKIQFRIDSQRDGHLLVIDIDASERISLIYPNQFSIRNRRDNRVRRNETVLIPDHSYGFDFQASEPTGRGLLFAVVTDQAIGQHRAIDDTLAALTAPPDYGTRGFAPQAREQAVQGTDRLRPLAQRLLDAFTRKLGPINGTWTATLLEYEIAR